MPENVLELLVSRFSTGGNRMQVRQAFMSRYQLEIDWIEYLDALEGLRSQGFPNEPITTNCYESMQRFIEGDRDTTLRRTLSII